MLGLVFTALPFLMAMGLGLLLPYLAWLFYQRFEAGLWAVALIFFLDVLFRDLLGLRLGIVVYPQDFVFVLIAMAALARMLLRAHPVPGRGLWLAFGAVLFISFAEGLVRNGTGAGVEFRIYFYLWAGTLYGMCFPMPPERVRRALGVFITLGIGIFFVVLYRWVVETVPFVDLLPEYGYWSDMPFRVVPSMQALVLGELFLLTTFFYTLHPWLASLRWLGALWLLMVVGVQHRSVWLATLVGLGVALFIKRAAKGAGQGQLLGTAMLFALILALLSLSGKFGNVSESIGSSAYRAVSLSDTAGERLYSWQQLVRKVFDGGVKSVVAGQPFGSDYTRYSGEGAGAKKIGYQAHNFFVQTLLRGGMLGVGLFLASAYWLARGLYRLRQDPGHGETARALLVLLMTQLVYYVPYGADYLQAMLFGIGASFVMHAARATGPGRRCRAARYDPAAVA